nr:hypothetical protein CFP56_09972 [Quercus suber]
MRSILRGLHEQLYFDAAAATAVQGAWRETKSVGHLLKPCMKAITSEVSPMLCRLLLNSFWRNSRCRFNSASFAFLARISSLRDSGDALARQHQRPACPERLAGKVQLPSLRLITTATYSSSNSACDLISPSQFFSRPPSVPSTLALPSIPHSRSRHRRTYDGFPERQHSPMERARLRRLLRLLAPKHHHPFRQDGPLTARIRPPAETHPRRETGMGGEEQARG